MLDTDALADLIAELVGDHVERATAPLITANAAQASRIAELEARALPVSMDEIKGVVEIMISDALVLKAPKDGRDGIDVDMEVVGTLVVEMTEQIISEQLPKAIASLPPALAGKDGEDGQDGRDGADVDMDVVRSLITEMSQKAVSAQLPEAVSALPPPAPGKDGRDGENGADGAGVADLLIDRAGALVATFTDGRTKSLGPVIGRDGENGADGQHGLGPDDLSMTLLEDGRTVRMAFAKGETAYSFDIPFPVVIDRGVFADGRDYVEGDGVTWGGSFWIAQRATSAKPDSPDSGFRLAVKRGRDGKDKS